MRALLSAAVTASVVALAQAATPAATDAALAQQFERTVHPFLETYCVTCHGKEKPESDLDLSPYTSVARVVDGFSYWELVLEKLEGAEMPPEKAKKHPTDAQRDAIVAWIHALKKNESLKSAGDPGPVLARRLNNAEYDYTIRDLTGVDIQPTKEFPVDPANQAGFDNSGESLAMSPALVKKYLAAARLVADHLVLQPDGIAFAPHPVVADTDRDKYSVLRIVDFYKRQPTDYADYFAAAWRYQHRAALGQAQATLADTAAAAKVSAKYLGTIWETLNAKGEDVGPIAHLQAMFRELPGPKSSNASSVREGCERMRDYVVQLREKLVPDVPNLAARGTGIQEGSQTLVMWKNRAMAANRQRYDPDALQIEGKLTATVRTPAPQGPTDRTAATPIPTPPAKMAKAPAANAASTLPRVEKGGKFLAPAITTTDSSATFQMAATKRHEGDPDLRVPADAEAREPYQAAFARFAAVFPDAFYITERARVYLDPEKEQKLAGRLLNAGIHSQTGFFRDDGPLYDLILDDAGRRELDALWAEFNFYAAIPVRMYTSMVWFERTDSAYLRDPEFDPYRPEDKSITTQAKIKQLGELYLAKATKNGASKQVQQAITEHFTWVADTNRWLDETRASAVPKHLQALEDFAARAWRRPLTTREREKLHAFYQTSREQNGVDHEDAMRDAVVSVLMSPNFCYRIDLIEAAGRSATNDAGSSRRQAAGAKKETQSANPDFKPLSDYALASRLSYFLWASMPDAELLARAAAGDLHRPEVLAAQARRMMQDPRAARLAVEFGGHWLDFRRFEEHNAVDRERFPAFDNELRTSMFEEPVRFFTDVLQHDRSVLDFLYGDYTFVNAPLAKHYGMPVTPAPGEWVRVDSASKYDRGGLLPMAVFLTANSPGLRTSPVKRGYWVVRRVLGERIPPPPPIVPELPADEKNLGELTLRDTLAKHRTDKTCASCHARFDSFGLVFEGYGPVGERREKDFGGRAVDTRAPFPGGYEGSGLAGLRTFIRDHRQADFIDNLCRKLVVYGLGRTTIMSDDDLIRDMKAKLAAHDFKLTALIDTLVTSPQFRTKRAPAAAPVKTASLP